MYMGLGVEYEGGEINERRAGSKHRLCGQIREATGDNTPPDYRSRPTTKPTTKQNFDFIKQK